MRLRRLTALASAAAIAIVGFVSAPPAHAASLGTVVYTDGTSTLTPNTLADAQVGDTFQIQAVTAFSNYMVNGTGSASIGVNACTQATPFNNSPCVLSYSLQTVTVTALGTMRILNSLGETTATLTLGSGSSGSSGSTAPTLEASQPPSVTATPGNSVVQLSITPGTGGTGSAYLYYVEYFSPSACVPDARAADQCPVRRAKVGAGESGSATTTIQGLENGYMYVFRVYEMTTDQLWSGATTVTATPTADATCSTLSIDVAQPGGKDAATVTPTVSATTSPAVYPFIAPPYGGTVKEPAMGAWTSAGATGAAGGEFATFTPTTDKPCPITVTAPEGTQLSLSTGGAWNAGSTSVTVYSGTPVYVFGAKTGDYAIPFKAGAASALNAAPKVRIGTVPQAAYKVAISPATQTLSSSALGTVTVSVSDVFGNAVAGVRTAVAATGEVLLAGYSAAQEVTTGATGSQTVTVIASSSAGNAVVTAAAPADSTAWAWQANYVKPSGFADPVKAAPATITVSAPITKSITITGERGTVSGKPGIIVDGSTSGFKEGDTVIPYLRFPGETVYTQGSARPVIEADGSFNWQRKTGKKTYVYFTSSDGSITSNRVIIPAK